MEMRRITGNATLNFNYLSKTPAVNTLIIENFTPTKILTHIPDHKVSQSNYKLKIFFEHYAVSEIADSFATQHIKEVEEKYMGYQYQTFHTTVAHINTGPVFLNQEKMACKEKSAIRRTCTSSISAANLSACR